jgi:hypothetical protein
MIEPLNKEKLKQYKFSKTQIKRLFDAEDYCCYNVNNTGFYFACNKENKIYSGIDGENKYLSVEPKEKFKTFDELILYAVKMESIEVANNIKFEAEKAVHQFNFNSYLRNIKLVEWENNNEYQNHLTKINWIEYYNFHLKEKENRKKDLELEKKSWQPVSMNVKTEQKLPIIFEELFIIPENAEPCLRILGELQPPIIDKQNNYIGKGKKGVFPLWIAILKENNPPLIKHFKDIVYKDLLNEKIKGLCLSKDASEFRTDYKRVNSSKIGLDIKSILSQYSQSGKLGK